MLEEQEAKNQLDLEQQPLAEFWMLSSPILADVILTTDLFNVGFWLYLKVILMS